MGAVLQWSSQAFWSPLHALLKTKNKPGVRQFLETHSHIALFHGCRPIDSASYYNYGIRVADIATLNKRAKEIFSPVHFPEISSDTLEEILNECSKIDEGVAFLCPDDQFLVKECGHYLIYGSEHICGIAAALTKSSGYPDYQQVLKRYGLPTLFRLHVPISGIAEKKVQEFYDHIFNYFSHEEFSHRDSPPPLNWCLTFSEDLPAEWIVWHHHPEEIPDPLNYKANYRYRDVPLG